MNKIAKLLERITNNDLKIKFVPDTEFFSIVKIGRKRWGQLVRNEKSPTVDELQSIAKYFKVPVLDLIEIDFVDDQKTT